MAAMQHIIARLIKKRGHDISKVREICDSKMYGLNDTTDFIQIASLLIVNEQYIDISALDQYVTDGLITADERLAIIAEVNA